MTLTPTALVLLGLLLAAWTIAALWAVAAARLGEWRPEVTEQEWEAKAAAQAARMRELAERRKARVGA